MIVSSYIDLKADELSEKEWRRLFKRLTFNDAEGVEVHSYRLLKGGRVRVPRGAWAFLPDHVRYVDNRVFPKRRALTFEPILDVGDREGQVEAFKRAMEEEQGLVIAQPGFGKTMVALAVVAEIRTPWIVFVHTEDIFNQWIEYAEKAIPGLRVGRIQGRMWSRGDLTVAMVQTIRDQMPRFRREWSDKFGGVIVDEAHHSPAETWELILNSCQARYRLGFTATESRADGKQALMQHLIGPVVFKQQFDSPVPVRVVPLKSKFKFAYRGRFDWSPLLNALVHDEDRNQLIGEAAARQLQKGHSVLVLSRRVKHLELIREHLQLALNFDEGYTQRVAILTGKTPKPKRLKMVHDFRAGEIKCLLSTQLADEALDVPILSRVFLTFPGKHDGRIIQQIGRSLRPHDDKTDAAIFDVVDDRISVLRRQWMERKRTYDKLKIKTMKLKNPEKVYSSPQQKRRVIADNIRKRMKRRR